MAKKQTGIQKSQSVDLSPERLLSQAIEKKLPVETMKELLEMRRALKAEWAKEQFDTAMADFQAECPIISKSADGAKTDSGKVAYKYAPLDSIVKQTKELLAKHGFSYQMKTETKGATIVASCTAKHISGHAETSSVEVPLGAKTKVMSFTQQTAAAMTYAKRYAFCDVFGILTGDDDDDAISTRADYSPTPPDKVFTRNVRDSVKVVEADQKSKELLIAEIYEIGAMMEKSQEEIRARLDDKYNKKMTQFNVAELKTIRDAMQKSYDNKQKKEKTPLDTDEVRKIGRARKLAAKVRAEEENEGLSGEEVDQILKEMDKEAVNDVTDSEK